MCCGAMDRKTVRARAQTAVLVVDDQFGSMRIIFINARQLAFSPLSSSHPLRLIQQQSSKIRFEGSLPVLPPIPTLDSVHASPARKKEREARERVREQWSC